MEDTACDPRTPCSRTGRPCRVRCDGRRVTKRHLSVFLAASERVRGRSDRRAVCLRLRAEINFPASYALPIKLQSELLIEDALNGLIPGNIVRQAER